ncbi:Asp-tRNA(Asn)/Glu-tRNA(Gln) amidotransferase subunit GatC [Planctomycetota bacterium]|nr:Asp-tRNA(Asn)/Glu-tRNA(Gln) amidotransferase subunit GatC [Planctomycetota bacterium]
MDEATVKHVAHLARLKLSDDDLKKFAADLTAITGYIDSIRAVDTEGVEVTVHAVPQRNAWREDEPLPQLTREQAVQNAPEHEQNFFKVPPVIE